MRCRTAERRSLLGINTTGGSGETAVRCSGTCPSPSMARPMEWGTKFDALGVEGTPGRKEMRT
jgi:hypothetical protein